jgi:uroporphyrinogen decarboxylase
MRLTQAALWKKGGKLASAFGGRVVCADIIVTTLRTDQPQVILPCSGDRIFGQTQDHEMAFTIPWHQMEDIIDGLRGTHAGGIRYPITQFMEYEAKLPPKYMEANRLWAAEKGTAPYTPRDRVVAAYKRSFADRVPVYPIVASFTDDKSLLAKIKMPDPYKTGRLPGFLEQCEALVKAKPPTAIGAVAVGPWTIAMLLRNPETMLLDTFEDPQFIHDVMRVATDFSKIWGDAIVKTGIGLSFSEPTASISLVSPDNYREFIAPYHKELVDHFKARKVGVTTHICGTTYPIFEDVIQAGFSTFSFDLDQQSDPTLYVDQLTRFMEVSKGRVVGIGNVDATKFEKTSKDLMYADVKRCIDAGAKHSGFILSTSCEIPPKSDPEIVKWFMDAAHEYGKYNRVFE